MSEDRAGILVAGAINTDLVGQFDYAPRSGETVAGTGFAVFGGGKAANQAVAAARSGASVRLIGAVGQDQFGQDRLKELERDGVDVSAVDVVGDVASGVAMILVERSGENRIAYIPGATARIRTDFTEEGSAFMSLSFLNGYETGNKEKRISRFVPV